MKYCWDSGNTCWLRRDLVLGKIIPGMMPSESASSDPAKALLPIRRTSVVWHSSEATFGFRSIAAQATCRSRRFLWHPVSC